MMWIDGISPLSVLGAYVGSGIALLCFGVPAAMQQQRYSRFLRQPQRKPRIEWVRLFIVAATLFVALLANILANLNFPVLLVEFPVIGMAVWVVILTTGFLRRPIGG